jgi:hypothetical protein
MYLIDKEYNYWLSVMKSNKIQITLTPQWLVEHWGEVAGWAVKKIATSDDQIDKLNKESTQYENIK